MLKSCVLLIFVVSVPKQLVCEAMRAAGFARKQTRLRPVTALHKLFLIFSSNISDRLVDSI